MTADRERFRQQFAGAVRAAAYACEGDCGLTEAQCHTAHPIQAAAPSGDVVTAPVDALAEAVLPLVEEMRAGMNVPGVRQDPPRPSTCVCGSTIRSLPRRALIHFPECPARGQDERNPMTYPMLPDHERLRQQIALALAEADQGDVLGTPEERAHEYLPEADAVLRVVGRYIAFGVARELGRQVPELPELRAELARLRGMVDQVRSYAESRCTDEHVNVASASWVLHLLDPAVGQDEATAEYHTVDGLRYLCHRDDHYCPTSEQDEASRMACATCETPVHWITSPTGGWWRHAQHPDDGHDASPMPASAIEQGGTE